MELFISLSAPSKYRKIVNRKKVEKKVQTEVSGKEEVDTDSRNVNNCDVLQVVKLLVVDKGVVKEVVVYFEIGNNQDGMVC